MDRHVISTNFVREIPTSQQVHVCAHCRHEPDGTEQLSAYEDAWLHPGCLDAFLKAKMAEQGIARSASAHQIKTTYKLTDTDWARLAETSH
jgi:hypothetical protein